MDMREHTLQAYDVALNKLAELIEQMGDMVMTQFDQALQALEERDDALAKSTHDLDRTLDDLEEEVHYYVTETIIRHQPVANDLRHINTCLRVAGNLERVGDNLKNVSKQAVVLNRLPPLPVTKEVIQLGRIARSMLKDVMSAFDRDNDGDALNILRFDDKLDKQYATLFGNIVERMKANSDDIAACVHLLFVIKKFERAGDHATNIAEAVHYNLTGEELPPRHAESNVFSYVTMTPGLEATSP